MQTFLTRLQCETPVYIDFSWKVVTLMRVAEASVHGALDCWSRQYLHL